MVQNDDDSPKISFIACAVVVERRQPTEDEPQHLCLDKGYDNPTGETAAVEAGYVSHIKRIGEEKKDDQGEKTYPARRWVVERTFSWLSRCRGILIRWDKKAECYLAQVKLACALLWFRRLHRLKSKEQAQNGEPMILLQNVMVGELFHDFTLPSAFLLHPLDQFTLVSAVGPN